MVEADPTALAESDVILESLLRDRRPPIRWIIELDEQLVLRERFFVDAFGARNVVNNEIVFNGQLVQVEFGGFDESLMVTAGTLRQRKNPELRPLRPSIRRLTV